MITLTEDVICVLRMLFYVHELLSLVLLLPVGLTLLALDKAFQTTMAMMMRAPRDITAAPVIAPATTPVVM